MHDVEPFIDDEVSLRITHLTNMLISAGAAANATDAEMAAVAGLVLARAIPGAVEPREEHNTVIAFYQDGVEHWSKTNGTEEPT
jgi:hypothetical protein